MGKRILFISNLYPNPMFPTMAAFNRQQINALSEMCEVEIISPIPWTNRFKDGYKHTVRLENNTVIHHPTYYYTPGILREWYGFFYYHSIKSIVRSLLEQKRFDFIFSSWLYPDSWAAAKLSKQFDLPLFIKVHGTDVNGLTPGSKITRKSMQVVNQAKKVICVSKALKNRLIELGAPENKLEVLYNGVGRNIFFPVDTLCTRKKLNIEEDEFLVLYVGNLKKEKGLYELIMSYKAATEAIQNKTRLVIIGSGAYRSTAEQLISENHITDRVLFLGNQPLDVIAQWMNAATLLCLPSYMEGVPNVVLEALACGTNVIATSVGGIPELDTGDGNIMLVPPKNVELLTAALKKHVLCVDKNTPPDFLCDWVENARRLINLFS